MRQSYRVTKSYFSSEKPKKITETEKYGNKIKIIFLVA